MILFHSRKIPLPGPCQLTLLPFLLDQVRWQKQPERDCPVSNLVLSHKGNYQHLELHSEAHFTSFRRIFFLKKIYKEKGKGNVCRKTNSESLKDPTEFNLFWRAGQLPLQGFLPAVLVKKHKLTASFNNFSSTAAARLRGNSYHIELWVICAVAAASNRQGSS